MTKSWDNIDSLGKLINKHIKKVSKLSGKSDDLQENIAALHAISQSAQTISSLKTTNIISQQLDRVEKLLAYIPQDVMKTALEKINEHE